MGVCEYGNGTSQVAITAVVQFRVGFELKDEGSGGKNHMFEKTVKKLSFSEDIHLMASLKNHRRFPRETETNKQKSRLRISIER